MPKATKAKRSTSGGRTKSAPPPPQPPRPRRTAAARRAVASPPTAAELLKALKEAAEEGDVVAARRLLAQGASARGKGNDGEDGPLHRAVVGLTDQLESDDDDDGTPGQRTRSEPPSFEMIDLLLAHGADIDAIGDAYPPLHLASNIGDLRTVKHLVARGANVQALDEYGQTALHAAAGHWSQDVYDYLLQLGLDPSQMDQDGRTPQDLMDRADSADDDSAASSSSSSHAKSRKVPVKEARAALERTLQEVAAGARSELKAVPALRAKLQRVLAAVASTPQPTHRAALTVQATRALTALVTDANTSAAAAAWMSTTTGALLELHPTPTSALAWDALGRAVVRPLEALLAAALAYARGIRALPASAGIGIVRLFGHQASTREASAVRSKHPDGVAALKGLDALYPAVVAAWTRAPDLLRQYQRPGCPTADGVRELGLGASDGVDQLVKLVGTMFALPVVVLVPELDEAYALEADGVAEMAQLYVLLSAALVDPLRSLGVRDRSRSAQHAAAALGSTAATSASSSSHDAHGAVSVAFHLFPWQATDPATQRPGLGRHMWTAPGGRGTHSLPADYLVSDLARIDGCAVVVLVGPRLRTLTQSMVRYVSAERAFRALPARVTGTRRLSASETARWFQTVSTMAPTSRVPPTPAELIDPVVAVTSL